MILQRRVWTRQPPPGTQIDWSNPLTKGLGVVVEGENKRDAARGLIPAVDTAQTSPSSAGIGLSFDGTASFLHGYSSAPVSSGDITLAALFVPNATGGIFGISSPASVTYGDQQLLLFNASGPVVSAYSVRDSDGGLVEAPVASPGVGVPQVAVGTFVNGGGRSIHVRGASASEGTAVTLGGFSQIAAGYVPVIGYILNGVVVRGLLWNRILAAHEITAILDNIWQIYEPQILPRFTPAMISVQYARPSSDVSAGTWTASSGSDLYAMLDESSPDDGDYIVTTGASTCEVALGSLSDPSSSAGHAVRYRLSATFGGITVRLRQGGTTIATWAHAPAPTSPTTYEQTLSSGEADSITDYTALKLQFEATT